MKKKNREREEKEISSLCKCKDIFSNLNMRDTHNERLRVTGRDREKQKKTGR